MEIEKKYLVDKIPFALDKFEYKAIEQSYISINPVIRIRKSNNEYFLTIKGSGKIIREEFELPLSQKQYLTLIQKTEGRVIKKTRYLIPIVGGHIAELDIYEGEFSSLKTVEVEFESIEDLHAFEAPKWFGKEVSSDSRYSNGSLSLHGMIN